MKRWRHLSQSRTCKLTARLTDAPPWGARIRTWEWGITPRRLHIVEDLLIARASNASSAKHQRPNTPPISIGFLRMFAENCGF
jgi:hypothetical protein